MVMRRIRKGSGSGIQIISSSSRHRAKNVDRASRQLEREFGYVANHAPSAPDPFAGAPDQRPRENAADAAQDGMKRISQGIMDGMGLTKGMGSLKVGEPCRVGMSMGDAMTVQGKRLIPKEQHGPGRFLKEGK